MKRRFYPQTIGEALGFSAGILSGLAAVFALSIGAYWMAAYFGSLVGLAAILVYGDQYLPERGDSSEYSAVIAQMGGIEKQLSELSAFLEREQNRVADTESTLSKLQDERTKLEPIVLTQKETVETILAPHSSGTARNVWKERSVGFILGMLASTLAAFIYGHFNRQTRRR